MRQADQTPLPKDVRQAPQQEATETPRFFALAKHGFHDDLPPGVQRLPCRRPDCRCHALLHRQGRRRGVGLRPMVALARGSDVRIKPSGLECLHRRFTVIAIIQGRRDGLDDAALVLGALNTCLGQVGQRRLGYRRGLLFVI